MIFCHVCEGGRVLVLIRYRTTVPLALKKSSNASYKKKVCLNSRLFPLGREGGTSERDPRNFGSKLFCVQIPENFSGPRRKTLKLLENLQIWCDPEKPRRIDLLTVRLERRP
jgi:hypothetical protein